MFIDILVINNTYRTVSQAFLPVFSLFPTFCSCCNASSIQFTALIMSHCCSVPAQAVLSKQLDLSFYFLHSVFRATLIELFDIC